MEINAGAIVKSLAGHDKDQIFFILKEDGEYVYLVDGKYRKLKTPKKKKKRHVEAVIQDGDSPGWKLKENKQVTDEELARFIKCFKREKH